jgi:hypothetical protein
MDALPPGRDSSLQEAHHAKYAGPAFDEERYFRSNGTRRWIITASPGKADSSASPSDLFQASSLAIRRHVKVRAEATAFDPDFQTYFRQRRGARKRADAAAQARPQRPASRTSQQREPRPGHVEVAQGKA